MKLDKLRAGILASLFFASAPAALGCGGMDAGPEAMTGVAVIDPQHDAPGSPGIAVKRVGADPRKPILEVQITGGPALEEVVFSVHGTALGALVSKPPFRYEVDTTKLPDGWRVIDIDARDVAQTTTTTSVSLLVDNTP